MRLTLLTLCCLSLTAHADDAQKEPEDKQAEGIKKAAEREARSSSPEGCKELLAESRLACGEIFTRGLKTNCFMLITGLQMGVKQAKGKLFEMGDGDTDVKVANASCRVHLRKVRRDREKGKDLPDAAQAAEDCRNLATGLDTDCFSEFAKSGTFGDGCMYVFRATMSPVFKAQPQCGGMLSALKKLNGQSTGAPK